MTKLIILFISLIFSLNSFSQFQTEYLSFEGSGDLVLNLGKYRIGTAIDIKFEVEGGWAEVGGIYHIAGNWNEIPKVIYRGESTTFSRLKFYGYVEGATFVYLFAKWENYSPNKEYGNIVRFTIQSSGYFDKNAQGVFGNAVELKNVFTIQSSTEKIGIGTSNPQNLLDVKGTIHAQEVKVDMNNWSDFVFHPSYQLKPLTEVEKFIKANGHLQDIPSAAEVEQNGVNVGEMQKKLLQKVEELTLYVIEKDKEIAKLKAEKDNQLAEQQKLLMELKKEIEILKTK